MNFDESVRYLYGLGNEVLTMKLGLDNIRALLAALGNPHRNYSKIQVAGTNGKGSVCAFLEAILIESGTGCGVMTSPHLVSITERIRINGKDIDEDSFARNATIVREVGEGLARGSDGERTVPTFFEQVTAIAALAFAEAGVRTAVLETGLGGRLDATTALDAEVAAVTRVDLDHQEWLGGTISEIAAEKAAIIRPDGFAVIGLQKPEAMQAILRRCEEVGVEPVCADRLERASGAAKSEFVGDSMALRSGRRDYRIDALGLIGSHQVENAIVAILAAERLSDSGLEGINESSVAAGLKSARHAGRLEFVDGVLLDGAHNVSGATALRRFLGRMRDVPVTFVFGAMREKDVSEIAKIVFPCAANVVAVKAESARALSASEIASHAHGIVGVERVFEAASTAEALATARELTPAEGLVCVTGSLYLVGEARRILTAS